MKTYTLKHPVFDDVTREVAEDELEAWLAQGWLPDEPDAEPDVPTPSDAPGDPGDKAPKPKPGPRR